MRFLTSVQLLRQELLRQGRPGQRRQQRGRLVPEPQHQRPGLPVRLRRRQVRPA